MSLASLSAYPTRFGSQGDQAHRQVTLTREGKYPVGEDIYFYTAQATTQNATGHLNRPPTRVSVDFYRSGENPSEARVNPFYSDRFEITAKGLRRVGPDKVPESHPSLQQTPASLALTRRELATDAYILAQEAVEDWQKLNPSA